MFVNLSGSAYSGEQPGVELPCCLEFDIAEREMGNQNTSATPS
jgi:hypothetical protein